MSQCKACENSIFDNTRYLRHTLHSIRKALMVSNVKQQRTALKFITTTCLSTHSRIRASLTNSEHIPHQKVRMLPRFAVPGVLQSVTANPSAQLAMPAAARWNAKESHFGKEPQKPSGRPTHPPLNCSTLRQPWYWLQAETRAVFHTAELEDSIR
ncbi:hypothetical protein NPIL_701131 [Nephila pilipes]|uniref:Uncharacterized protein n=1 Tax=Nephila pilipes TaxID=299642 RepID=A0A8X6T8X9_NEPPI|nr:hypothetical protein NPIL_701131 [Nephila pilipes]